MPSSVPVIDLTSWFSGGPAERGAVAAEVDAALQSVGFFLVTGTAIVIFNMIADIMYGFLDPRIRLS